MDIIYGTSNIICVYHYRCPDGEMAATIFRRNFPNSTFFGWRHELKEENIIEIKNLINESTVKVQIYFLDVCPSFEFILEIKDKIDSLFIIDHHKAACEKFITDKEEHQIEIGYFEIKSQDYTLEVNKNKKNMNFKMIYDVSKSGCQLTWKYFYDTDYHPSVYYIGSKDIYDWTNKNTEPFTTGYQIYFSLSNDMTSIERLNLYELILSSDDNVISEVIKLGKPMIDDYKEECLKLLPLVKLTEDTDKFGKDISIVEIPMTKYHLIKYILELVQKEFPSYDVLKLIFTRDNKIIYSLRSIREDIRVDHLAQKYGGNGHPAASGYSVDI